MTRIPLLILPALLTMLGASRAGEDQPIKVFLLAGQSNMDGYGNGSELPEALQTGNERVLMFEEGRWQPLRPHQPATKGKQRLGLTQFSFGPEIGFAQEMSQAWPDETIGIVKHAVGGTSILAWKPDWSREEADRVGQGRHGPLYRQLMDKLAVARKERDIEIVGFLWVQGGADMKREDTAGEYLDNLKSLVAAVRNDTGVPDLPFLYSSPRQAEHPDSFADITPQQTEGPYAFFQTVLKAQWDAQQAIPNAHMVILRDIESHHQNVHYNTQGQLEVGRLFAEKFLSLEATQ